MADYPDDTRVSMPLKISSAMMDAVRNNPLTRCDDLEMWYSRLGWLICAYDVMVKTAIEEGEVNEELGRG